MKGIDCLDEIWNTIDHFNQVSNNAYIDLEKLNDCFQTIECELKQAELIKIIKQKGIALIIPDNDFSNEHITIEIYTKHLTKEQLDLFKGELNL